MIKAQFFEKQGSLTGVRVSGHAGFADFGQDIVCASVTSAVQMAVNGITEILKAPCKVRAEENCIEALLSDQGEAVQAAVLLLEALRLQLTLLEEDYGKYVKVIVLEVL